MTPEIQSSKSQRCIAQHLNRKSKAKDTQFVNQHDSFVRRISMAAVPTISSDRKSILLCPIITHSSTTGNSTAISPATERAQFCHTFDPSSESQLIIASIYTISSDKAESEPHTEVAKIPASHNPRRTFSLRKVHDKLRDTLRRRPSIR
ncbi:hypothetical protein SARC_04660 [Sphaeroforma arctica JP610]|uniref:Uncharacterized protein n=1 Tax=Sphaeroforma arctica JP610 TaxID=667725 RepID=A0A0L0G1S4_9EUKA|nr:hypothetical protein SARC_04660 [Sphaeroforma arctica JP610]KNC83067.1 hypothetical protein SARC_04660 [Sphaeroforma arctica JP610]|eukprot:XP_014156969.1 hypothetical protein SARC_04660 [Sphaeroforma arctica JP610]